MHRTAATTTAQPADTASALSGNFSCDVRNKAGEPAKWTCTSKNTYSNHCVFQATIQFPSGQCVPRMTAALSTISNDATSALDITTSAAVACAPPLTTQQLVRSTNITLQYCNDYANCQSVLTAYGGSKNGCLNPLVMQRCAKTCGDHCGHQYFTLYLSQHCAPLSWAAPPSFASTINGTNKDTTAPVVTPDALTSSTPTTRTHTPSTHDSKPVSPSTSVGVSTMVTTSSRDMSTTVSITHVVAVVAT